MMVDGGNTDVRAEALAELQRAKMYLGHDPENVALLSRVAGLALRAGLPAEADEAIRRLARCVGESASVLQLRAQLLMADRQFDGAIPLLEKACSLSGEPGVRSDLAVALWRRGRHRECVALVGDVVSGNDPASLPTPMLTSFLRSLHALGELDAAQGFFDALAGAGRLDDELRGVGALILFDLDLADAAADLLAGIARPANMNLEACVVGGYLAVARQDTAAATALFEPALAKSPGDPRTMLGLGLARMTEGDLAKAEAWLRQAVERMPSHLGSWHALGWCRFCAGDLQEATAVFRSALEVDRTFGESHGALAAMLALAGDREEAEHSLARARKLDPDSASAAFAEMVLRGNATPTEVQALARRLMSRQSGAR